MKKPRQLEAAEEPVGIVISQGSRTPQSTPAFSAYVWGSEQEPAGTTTLTPA